MAAIGFLLLFLLGGVMIIRMLLPGKSPLVRLWLGVSAGLLLMMQLPALCAYAFDFSLKAHAAAAALLAMLVLLCAGFAGREAFQRNGQEKRSVRAALARPLRAVGAGLTGKKELRALSWEDKRLLPMLVVLVLPLTALSAYLQYTHMLMPASDGSYWCGQSTYGDLCMHLSFITSMKDMAFPPDYNLLYGTKLAYPYLADALSTSFLLMGMELNASLIVPGTLLMALTYAGFMLLAAQILHDRPRAVAVAALFFFLNGGLGFLYDFDLAGRDQFQRIGEIFTGYYKTPANQPDYNLRFSNVIADLLIPQRALLGGWAMVLPALYLLISSQKERSMVQTVLLALWAGALPLVHTHTFLALGLFSGGYLLGRIIMEPRAWKGVLARSGVYLGIVLLLAAPQLLGNAIEQTVEGGVLRFQFNWVNNSGNRGMIDFYSWFWVKNVGLPFLLMLGAVLCAKKRGYVDIVLGMTAIFVVAETILFQRNEYDNNKLFYIWYMFAAMLAADYGSMLMQRLRGLPGRNLFCLLLVLLSVTSGALSIARETVSGYQLFGRKHVEAGKWIEENTDKDAVFLTGQQHINPVCSLAGRQIICGSDLYVFFHGLNYAQQAKDCERFYEQPAQNADVLDAYGVDYIYVSDYERSEFDVDLEAIEESYALVYENPDVRIYEVTQ